MEAMVVAATTVGEVEDIMVAAVEVIMGAVGATVEV